MAVGVIQLIVRGEPARPLEISFAVGDLWMLGTSVIFTVYSILIKQNPNFLSIWLFQLSTFILGRMFLVHFFAWESVSRTPIPSDTKTLFSIEYVGIFASLTAFILWNKAVVSTGP